jgi:hypothetical protein
MSTEYSAESTLEHAIDSWVHHRADTVTQLERALALDPDLALGHLLLGFLVKLLGRADLEPGVRRALGHAQRTLGPQGGPSRERTLATALAHWCDGHPEEASAALERRLEETPTDLLVLKLAHSLAFVRGRPASMRRTLESVLPAWDDRRPGYANVLGLYAFALGETGDLPAAERHGRESTLRDPRDLWAIHAVCHVFDARNDHAAGLAWTREHELVTIGASNFAGHIAWHRALFHLELADPASSLSLYDERIAVHGVRDYRDVANASSLLYLLARRGSSVEARASALADAVLGRAIEHDCPLADLHLLLALVFAGRMDGARERVSSLRRHAAITPGETALTAREVGLPLAEGIVLFGEERLEDASRAFASVRSELQRLGGSHAQRRIFLQLERDAATGAGLSSRGER